MAKQISYLFLELTQYQQLCFTDDLQRHVGMYLFLCEFYSDKTGTRYQRNLQLIVILATKPNKIVVVEAQTQNR